MGEGALRRRTGLGSKKWVAFSPVVVCAMVLVLVPFFTSTYVQTIAAKMLIFAIFAMSLDLLFGYTGLVSLGHAAYYGAAVYSVGFLTVRLGVESFWVTAPIGILMATLFAAIFGVIALRVSGIYFMLVTFALGELLFHVVWVWRSVTGGSDGIVNIPPPDLGVSWIEWNSGSFYYFVFAVFVVCFLLLYRIAHSPFGRVLKGIRENEQRMESLGFNVWKCKYVSFILSGAFAGVSGVLFAYFIGGAHPSYLGIEMSGLVLFMVIVGGAGSLLGPIIGSGIILVLQSFGSIIFPDRWPVVLGGVFILTAMYFQGGIYTHLLIFWKRVRDKVENTAG